MRVGAVISFYDEYLLVRYSMQEILKHHPDAIIVVSHSVPEIMEKDLVKHFEWIKKNSYYIPLKNLGKDYDRIELASQAITRNFSKGFSKLYELDFDYDIIVSFTGDTLLKDGESINRRFNDMTTYQKEAMVSQAIGQMFHSEGPNGEFLPASRYQDPNITDFACCIWFIKGDFAKRTKVFKKIKITNKYTSEQCLGDELVRALKTEQKDFKTKVMRLNDLSPYQAYSYSDGVTYHAHSNGIPAHRGD